MNLKNLLPIILCLFTHSLIAQNYISPSNKNIQIEGAYFQKMVNENELQLHRHSEKIYAQKAKELLFNPNKARSGSGIIIKFKTSSEKVTLHFKAIKGGKGRMQFGVMENGKLNSLQKAKYNLDIDFEISFSSKNKNASSEYWVSLPLFIDTHFKGITLDEGSQLEKFSKKKKKKYVAFGDSITHGRGQNTTFETYPYQVAETLDYELFNIAVGGGKTSTAAAEMLRDEFDEIDLMTILIGYNDYNGQGVSPEEYKKRYHSVLKTIREKHHSTKLFCITPTFTTQKKSKKSGLAIEEFREVVRDVVIEAKAAGDRNIFLIEGEKYSDENSLNDKVHLNVEGAQKLAEGIIAEYKYSTIPITAMSSSNQPNILFICIDDLRNNLGCYDDKQAITPNIDALAKQSVVFRNHQVQYAVCGPSRAALMTSLMPEETGVIGFKPIRGKLKDVIFLPQHFKNNGYNTAASGKINDPRTVGEPIEGSKKLKKGDDDFASWTINYDLPPKGHSAKGMSMDFSELPDEDYVDGKIRKEGIELLNTLAKKEEPFFLAIGFKKPHEPFIAPKKYWDLYENTKFEVAKNQNAPIGREDLKRYAIKGKDVKANMNKETKIINEDFQLKLKKAYYACTSFVDAQVGMILEEVEKLGLTENTIIVIWGDHGLFLGEHGRWNKHSNLEVAAAAPLIIYNPATKNITGNTFAPVSTIDLYPTLCELAGLEIPEQPINNNTSAGRPLKGRSLTPILKDTDARVKMGAVTLYRGKRGLGYGYRTEHYRYVEWAKKGKENSYELYDYSIDPHETKNLAVTDTDQYESLLHKFSRDIRNMGECGGCNALLKTAPYEMSKDNKGKELPRDFDGDGISNEEEGIGDMDKDGILDYLDGKGKK